MNKEITLYYLYLTQAVGNTLPLRLDMMCSKIAIICKLDYQKKK